MWVKNNQRKLDFIVYFSSCCCGYAAINHQSSAFERKITEHWNTELCVVEEYPTDAFGEVKFTFNNDNIAKVSETYLSILIYKWNYMKPFSSISIFYSKNWI